MSLFGVPREFHEQVSDDGRHVRLEDTQLTSVPEWLANLTALTTLELGHNQLTSIPESLSHLTEAEGAALRALRAVIFEHDPLRAFGGLRRVQAPAGDLLWICQHHYPDYDPVLPVIQ